MKKTLIILTILLLGLQAHAQDGFTPEGKITIDLNFDPAAIFDAGAGSMFYLPYIKARYFIASDAALRLGFDLELEGDKDFQDADGDLYVKSSSAYFGLAPGYEKQFGSERFYFYLGADLPISVYSTKEVQDIGGTTIESKNPNGGYFSIGVDFVVGIDYYIFPNFYIGAELNPGVSFMKYFDTSVDGTVTEKGGTGSYFGLADGSGVRLGVRF